jgi:hypothetical protein
MPVARIRRPAPELEHERAAHARLDGTHVVPLLRYEAQAVAARQLVPALARRGEHPSLALGGLGEQHLSKARAVRRVSSSLPARGPLLV